MASNDSVADYFQRPAERLVLEGARLWSQQRGGAGARGLYEGLIGGRAAAAALRELEAFMQVLGRCAACPLKGFPAGIRHVSRDEVLLLGLVSAIQHGDDGVARTCLDRLACPSRCEEVALAAASFAITLRSFGHRLLPVPLAAVEDVLVRSRSVTLH